MNTPIQPFKSGEPIVLPKSTSWPESVHIMDDRSGWAVRAALAAQRPLLIRGEPGCGKSQLARAAAVHFKRAFVSEVVHARADCRDLQWTFDAVARLGEAQTLGSAGTGENSKLDPLRFLAPGPLWWAFDWSSATKQAESFHGASREPWQPEGWELKNGCVVLIDEIDKAETDLPNGLLEILGNGAFTVPHHKAVIGRNPNIAPPLVVITTNEERELPAAFVRRCMVLQLRLPKQGLMGWLLERANAHFKQDLSQELMKDTADLLIQDRRHSLNKGFPPPGLAEYLDLLRALKNLGDDEKTRKEALAEISQFALVKHEDQEDKPEGKLAQDTEDDESGQ